MREVTALMIEENGGRVILAVDGREAVEVFTKHQHEIDAVFLDFSMPRMNGYSVYLEIRSISKDVGIVMVSGLSATPEIDRLARMGDLVFLAKPFHESELIEALLASFGRKRAG